jgi:phage/plasmid primase-like uncharacterized protein
MNLKQLAKALGVSVNGAGINIPGPGHSWNDRSLGVFFDTHAPDGFWVNSFAGDDPKMCRAHVKALLRKKITIDDAILLTPDDDEAEQSKKKAATSALAFSTWNEGQSIYGTPAETYLLARGCSPFKGEAWTPELRFHPACRFGGQWVPAMVGLMRNVITGEPTGIHRTALTHDGSGKRAMPNGMPSKMMMGRAKRAAIHIHPAGSRLGIAEGIETALSAHQIFEMPVWAAMSAIGIRDFPVIHGIKFLRIFADNDEVGLSAARSCKRRYQAAGIEVEIRYPRELNNDWNDHLMKEIHDEIDT